jgi:hypothetical protein
MRTEWKDQAKPLLSHADWCDQVAKKNRKQGTSAPTLAAVWSGPVELHGALSREPHLRDLCLTKVVVERESHFDAHGGPRNHDLVAHGHLPDNETVIVCVEAKAGEHLDRTVERYDKDAWNKRANGQATNAPERLAALLNRYVPYDQAEERVRLMRYQFLSALAGTEAEAESNDADHAVLMLHDFMTDERPDDKTAEHAADWHRFCTTVFDCETPPADDVPWCFEVPAPETMQARLYLAWAVTDLRTATLEQ